MNSVSAGHIILTLTQPVSNSEERWKEVKKVESLIDDNEDVERRKQIATVALYKLNNVWIKGNK